MATQPTNNAVPSESPRDLKFNAGKIDEYVTSLTTQYIDRFGRAHYTIEGLRKWAQEAISSFGYITMDSFQDGAKLTLPNQVLRDEATGEYYRWDGDFPKEVPAGSTPDSSGGVDFGAWVSVGDAALRALLASKEGYSLIGELQSVADFYGMTGANGKKVHLKGWYSSTTYGEGTFYFDPTVPKPNHDGGICISPTVPYSTPDEFISGIGETDASGNGVWIRAGVISELRGEWYGMLNGVDVTVMSNKMAQTAGKFALGLVWPTGNMKLTGPVTISCDNSATGLVTYIRGAGKRGTVFTVDVNYVKTFAITVIGSIGSSNAVHDMVTIKGIKFKGTGSKAAGTAYTGTALYLQNILGYHLEDVNTENLNRGLVVQNSLYGCAVSCRFQSGGECVLLRRNSLTTGVNAMHFIRCDFNDNALYCVNASESHSVMFTQCTFEGNGGKTDASGAVIAGVCCVQMAAVGGAGGVGAVFDSCYFESNAIMDIKHVVSSNTNQTLTIRNCIFNKTRNDMTAGRVQMIRSSGGNGKSTLEMTGNRFLSGTNNADATYPDVEITGFQSLGYGKAEFLDLNNVFTANNQVVKDAYVTWKKANDDGFVCRGLSSGGFTAALSRNILSSTRSGTGTYRIITNQLTSLFDYQVTLDNLGFAIIDTSENNEAFTIKTYNGSGALADVGFRVRGKLI
ncbi:tail fiber/spike domain-containing protein [Erwinia oleae]|uniref:tail fiber/spike domain-containing protein n=1 Tax=Erwinia oleae TaxID=796334 RepID=UPI0005518A31|nr:hypothetical protein [Erwinia oleae]